VSAALRGFVGEREWDQFHSPEDFAKSIVIEAAELLECFQWHADPAPEKLASELADVPTHCRLLAAKLDRDPDRIVASRGRNTHSRRPAARARNMINFRIEKLKLAKGELSMFGFSRPPAS
jgi:dCTP diphosphatase